MSDPVLVGTDGSACADSAVDWAADDAALRGRPLQIVHSVDKGLYELPLFSPGQMAHQVAEAGERILAEAARRARERRPGVEVTTDLVAEGTATALEQRSRNAFELVVGNRGMGGFASLLVGSTSLRMAGHAAGPVVIVRGDVVPGHNEIVAGIDLEADPAETLRYAFEAAALRGARIRVMYAWRLGETLGRAGELDDKDVQEKLRWEVVKAHEPWRKTYPGIDVVEDVLQEHPVTALCDASRAADLVVVGAHDHNWFDVPRLGSVSHGVVHHAECPVVIARARTH
ncbi:universal stress protein [Actinomadura viridis]|uniref:Nucleotide-binding universal stress UspA family protein n=1 Tax=Actinomadura viridis TaxID=58110 RepID=A0A931DKE4_9ACTN|nr:universal stress protein [Actinomadura viridis]MBG6089176.1 nucleotide-binding universal stress UspA family protein [Actinomadura viridis]